MSKRAEKLKTSRSLAATLTTAFLVLSLATVVVVNLSLFLLIGQAIQDSIDSRQQLAAQEAANTVASFIQEKFSVLETAVKLGDLTAAPQGEQKRTLEDLLGLDRAFRQSILFDSQGQDLVKVSRISQMAAEQLLDRAGNDLFAEVKQGNRYISSVYIDEATSEPMVVMAVPAVDILGDFQGTLLAEVNLKFMWDLVDRLKVGETGLAYVVDRQGNLLAFGDSSRVLRGESVSNLDPVSRFMRSPVSGDRAATSISQGINGTTMVGTYVPLGVPDWAVVTELPMTEAYRSGIQSTVIAVIVMLVMALLAGLLAVYLARRLAAPMLNLTATAGRIAAGETDLQADIEGPTEVASLATAFNTMTAQLRGLIGTLEQRVADRTRDLERRAVQVTAAAEVGHVATSTLDPGKLAQQTVDLLRERFDLYYAGLFLVDEAGEYAVLEAGTGEPGRIMKEQGHKLAVGKESMVGTACADRKAHIAIDAGAEPGRQGHAAQVRFANPLLPDTRSEMALPLVVGNRVLGALDVQSTQPAAFSEQDIEVLQLAANQVAVAVDNARKFSSEAALLEATSPLFGVSRRLAEAVTVDQTAQAIVDSVAETEADGCAVATFEFSPDGEVETMTFLGSWSRTGSSPFPVGIPLPASALMLPAPMRGRLLIVPDVLEETEMPDSLRQTLARHGTRAAVSVPLRTGGRTIGMVIVERATPGPFSPVSLTLYEALVEQAAVALERARLIEETQRRADQERWLSQVSDQMQRAGDMESLLQVAAEEVNRELGGSRAYVRLGRQGQAGAGGDGREGVRR